MTVFIAPTLTTRPQRTLPLKSLFKKGGLNREWSKTGGGVVFVGKPRARYKNENVQRVLQHGARLALGFLRIFDRRIVHLLESGNFDLYR